MQRIALLAVLVMVPNVTEGQHRWTAPDRVWMAAAGGAIAADCGYTLSIRDQPNFREFNPFLGKQPSKGLIVTMCAVSAVSVWAIADALKPKARRWFLRGVIAAELLALGITIANTQ